MEAHEILFWAVGVSGAVYIVGSIISSRHGSGEREPEFIRQPRSDSRLQRMIAKYGDTELARKIYRSSIWTGMTTDQLCDSVGRPEDVDDKLVKGTRRQIWKYHRIGRGRWRMRITLENGYVVGWDIK